MRVVATDASDPLLVVLRGRPARVIHVEVLLPMPVGGAIRKKGRRGTEGFGDELQGLGPARLVTDREIEGLGGKVGRGRVLRPDMAAPAAFAGTVNDGEDGFTAVGHVIAPGTVAGLAANVQFLPGPRGRVVTGGVAAGTFHRPVPERFVVGVTLGDRIPLVLGHGVGPVGAGPVRPDVAFFLVPATHDPVHVVGGGGVGLAEVAVNDARQVGVDPDHLGVNGLLELLVLGAMTTRARFAAHVGVGPGQRQSCQGEQ